MRRRSLITELLSGVYLRNSRRALRVFDSSTTLYVEIKPSSFSTRAISILSLDAGNSTRACRALAALRMRVSMSEMGSVCILPTRLDHAGNLAAQRVTAETDAAHLELANVAARPPADAAAVSLAI